MRNPPKDPFAKRGGGFSGFGQGKFKTSDRKKDFRAPEVRPPDLDSADFEYTLQKLKNPALARRVLKLKEQYPDGTTPELVTVDWLNSHQIDYIYQLQYGPRNSAGNLRPDFLLPNRGYGMVWEVNGEYFHTQRKTPESDAARRLRLLNQEIDGVMVRSVVDVWERDIYDNPDKVFELALTGTGLR